MNERGPASPDWLAATGQRWKLWVFHAAFAVAACTAVAALLSFNDLLFVERKPLLALAWAVTGAIAFSWLVVSIRCPNCQGHPVWTMVNRQMTSNWFTSILGMSSCPFCGSDGSDVSTKPDRRT